MSKDDQTPEVPAQAGTVPTPSETDRYSGYYEIKGVQLDSALVIVAMRDGSRIYAEGNDVTKAISVPGVYEVYKAGAPASDFAGLISNTGRLSPGYSLKPWTEVAPTSRPNFSGWLIKDNIIDFRAGKALCDYKKNSIKCPTVDGQARSIDYDFGSYGLFACYGAAASGKSMFLKALCHANNAPIWFMGEREFPSAPASGMLLSRLIYEMLVFEPAAGSTEHPSLVALDSIAYLSIINAMGAGLAKGGVAKDPIAFCQSLQAVFRARRKIALIVINPLGEPDASYLDALQGGASGVLSFGSGASKVSAAGSPGTPNHSLIWHVFAQTPGSDRRALNYKFKLPIHEIVFKQRDSK